MPWIFYFPVISSLIYGDVSPRIKTLVHEAKINEAMMQAGKLADEIHRSASKETQGAALALIGDLQLATGWHEEAEESLRKSQRLMKTSLEGLRLHSCRNTAWQSLSLGRLCTALSCFLALAQDSAPGSGQQLEGLVGACFVLHKLGYFDEATRKLDEMISVATRARMDAWLQLAQTIQTDFLVQHEIRLSPRLNDHIFWRAAVLNAGAMATRPQFCAATLPRILTYRLDHLEKLLALSRGDTHAAEPLYAHLRWAAAESHDYHDIVKVEIALAALSADESQIAETMLDIPRALAGSKTPTGGQADIEYMYCIAKIYQHLGQTDASMRYFERYALRAMQCMRAEVLPAASRGCLVSRKMGGASDDISALLPAKYRRAYTYMLENLDKSDLSVREIAAQVGVTQRSLQIVFKNYVGLSPTEVIRRRRMERIHGELINGEQIGSSILDIAKKWGVQNRSTLANGYWKQYQETPSDTLVR